MAVLLSTTKLALAGKLLILIVLRTLFLVKVHVQGEILADGLASRRLQAKTPDVWDKENGFDLQAHRGGLGLTTEATLTGFAKALEIGVSTLELDVQITKDGYAVVTHDRQVSASKCRDTVPLKEDDPQFPYVGKYITNLTLAQVWTLDCGSMQLKDRPDQQLVRGARQPLLSEVFALVKEYNAKDKVWLNVEPKVEAAAPNETAPRELFVQVVVEEIKKADMMDSVTIQSFDWATLMLMREVEPRLPIVVLDNSNFLQVGQPGASVWLGGIDIDDFDGDVVAAVKSFGANALSPVHGMPQNGKVMDEDYVPYTTPELVERAHDAGIAVIPWTINDRATMSSLIEAGVDGIITDYPDRLRQLMLEYQLDLPQCFPAPESIDDSMCHSSCQPPPSPPKEDCSTITEIACNTDGFETLCVAIQAAGLDETLDESGIFTVFAPTDDAFGNLPDGTLDALLGDTTALIDILLFHAVAGKVYSSDLKCTETVHMVNGVDSRTVCSGGKIFQKGKGNSRDAMPEIISTDIEACKGVVHVVSEVMLPR